MASLKANVKNTALRALRATGAYNFAANSGRRREELLILCYHGLALRDEAEWAGHLFITAVHFRARLACLRAFKASVLPLSEAVERLHAGTLPARSVAITFDDGFYDFLQLGVPLLQEFGFPATLYLTTHYSGLPYPIINLMLDYLLWKSGRKTIAFPEQGIAEELPLTDWRGRMEVVRRLLLWLTEKHFDSEAKDEFARSVAQLFGIDYDDLLRSRVAQILTPEEAARVSNAGVDLQLHTHRHRTPRNHDLFVREIRDNAERIAAISGKQPVHFCYPSGVHEAEFLPWLRESNVLTATTCERGFARKDSEDLLLPRLLDDSNMDLVQFEAFVSGFLRS